MGEESKSLGIYVAIPKVMADLSAIGKDQTNRSQNFKYRGIDDVYNGVQKIMAKHGVFSVPSILSRERKEIVAKSGAVAIHAIYQYKFEFFASDGSSVSVYTDGEGIDYGDKVANKCASIAHKYALLQLFCIPTEELKDPDAESHEVKKTTPVEVKKPKITPVEVKPPVSTPVEVPKPTDVMKPFSLNPVFKKDNSADMSWLNAELKANDVPVDSWIKAATWLDGKPKVALEAAFAKGRNSAD